MSHDLVQMDPVGQLLARVKGEPAAEFDLSLPLRISRAPGRLDVMGGIADYTGSLVCQATLDRAAAVAVQRRNDRNVQVMSFNLFDEHQPFTVVIGLDALAGQGIDALRQGFSDPGRRWAGYVAGGLAILHGQGWINLADASAGFNLALYSTVPAGAGVSSSAAIEVAAMMNFAAWFDLLPASRGEKTLDPLMLAELCQQVENRVVGAPCGIMDQVSSCAGEADSLLQLLCQPHQLQPALKLPAGIRAVGINSKVRHSVGGGMYGKTRCAAFMGHAIILAKMHEMGQAAGKQLLCDPTNGYLANLDADDYKKYFRHYLPEHLSGADFLEQFGGTVDKATKVDAAQSYHVRQATDHHVLEARRVGNFAKYLQEAAALPVESPKRKLALAKAGHLMYASHLSYTNDALLGADECDLLVELVRRREAAGLYGAKITGGGSGGTVAVLCDQSETADSALAQILDDYHGKTGLRPELLLGSSPGAWAVGTRMID